MQVRLLWETSLPRITTYWNPVLPDVVGEVDQTFLGADPRRVAVPTGNAFRILAYGYHFSRFSGPVILGILQRGMHRESIQRNLIRTDAVMSRRAGI